MIWYHCTMYESDISPRYDLVKERLNGFWKSPPAASSSVVRRSNHRDVPPVSGENFIDDLMNSNVPEVEPW